MPRYIDADALMEYVEKTDWYSILRGNMTVGAENSEKAWYKAADIYAAIEIAPTIEARPVVRGEWFSLTDCANAGVYCSVCYKKVWKEDYAWCNRKNRLRSNFCPNCGADMRPKED